MESMTGYGSSVQTVPGQTVTAMARSVNNRGLGISIKMPRELAHLEEDIYRTGRNLFQRGRIDLTVTLEGHDCTMAPQPDLSLAEAYIRGMNTLCETFSIGGTPDAFGLLCLPGVMRISAPGPDRMLESMVLQAAEEALQSLHDSRKREGNGLEAVFREALSSIGELSKQVFLEHADRVEEIFKRRKARVTELLDGLCVDEDRMLQELALLSDRIDISEEHQRLSAHVGTALELLPLDDSGRKLGFILQEMHREANTMGSKVDCSSGVRCTIEMKDLLGGLREQVANVQ